MNTTSRAILQTVLTTDQSLSTAERDLIQQVMDGVPAVVAKTGFTDDGRLLITQKVAAKLLSVSRVTVWRLTKDGVLHPVEILPGTWRYPYREVESLARAGWRGEPTELRGAVRRAIPA